MGERARLALLLALCALLFFLGLGTLGLTDRDEGSNAEAAREMVASGDWITPTLNGALRFAKPILIYWLISGSYLAFGVSEFTARLPSALFGTLLVLMQYAFATRMFGPTVGLRAALMLLLNFEVLALGRMVLTDMVLVFFTTLSIFCFFLAASPPAGEGRGKRWYWGFYIGMALATLTKGPVGVLVPLLAVIPYLLLTGRWRAVARECRLLPGTAVFIFFTLSSTRLPHYIAPLFPAAALLVAASWDRSLSAQGGRAGAVSFWLTLGVGCVLGLAFVGLDWAYERFNAQIVQEFPAAAQVDPGWAPMAIGFLILGGMGLFGYAALTAGRAGLSFGIASGLMGGIALLIVTVALPRFNQYFIEPPQVLADIAGLNLEESDTLVVYGRPKPSLLFYAKRHCPAGKPCIEVIKPGEEEKLSPVLDRPGQIMILTMDRLRAKLPAPAPPHQLVVSRHGYVLLAKKPVFKS